MSVRRVGAGRIGVALAVAVLADVVQVPVNLAFLVATGSVVGIAADAPLEGLDLLIDLVTAGVMIGLLGFDLALLPTFVIELVPGIDAAPTWTACVAYVAFKRRRAMKAAP